MILTRSAYYLIHLKENMTLSTFRRSCKISYRQAWLLLEFLEKFDYIIKNPIKKNKRTINITDKGIYLISTIRSIIFHHNKQTNKQTNKRIKWQYME